MDLELSAELDQIMDAASVAALRSLNASFDLREGLQALLDDAGIDADADELLDRSG